MQLIDKYAQSHSNTLNLSKLMSDVFPLVIDHIFEELGHKWALYISMTSKIWQNCIVDILYRHNKTGICNELAEMSACIEDSQLHVRILKKLNFPNFVEFSTYKWSRYLADINLANAELSALEEITLLKQSHIDKIFSNTRMGKRIMTDRNLIKNMPSSITSEEKASYLILNIQPSYYKKSLHISVIVDKVFFAVEGDLRYLGDYAFLLVDWYHKSTLESLNNLIKGSRDILVRYYSDAGLHFLSKNQPNAAQLFLQFLNSTQYHRVHLLHNLDTALKAQKTEEAQSYLMELHKICCKTDFNIALYSYFSFFASRRSKDACFLVYKRVLYNFGIINSSKINVNTVFLGSFAQIFLKAAVDSCNFLLVTDFQDTFCKSFEYDADFILWKDSFKKECNNYQQKQKKLTNARAIQRAEELIASKQRINFLLHVEKLCQMEIDVSIIRTMSEKMFAHLDKNDEVQDIIQAIISISVPSIQAQIIDTLYYRLLALGRSKEALHVLFYIPNSKDKNNLIDSFLSNLHYDLEERQIFIALSLCLSDPFEQFETLCLSIGLV
jgi:hypothetical protein